MINLMTVKDVAKTLKVCVPVVQRMCKSGSLPAVKIGKSYRIEVSEFETWYRSKTSQQ